MNNICPGFKRMGRQICQFNYNSNKLICFDLQIIKKNLKSHKFKSKISNHCSLQCRLLVYCWKFVNRLNRNTDKKNIWSTTYMYKHIETRIKFLSLYLIPFLAIYNTQKNHKNYLNKIILNQCFWFFKKESENNWMNICTTKLRYVKKPENFCV